MEATGDIRRPRRMDHFEKCTNPQKEGEGSLIEAFVPDENILSPTQTLFRKLPW